MGRRLRSSFSGRFGHAAPPAVDRRARRLHVPVSGAWQNPRHGTHLVRAHLRPPQGPGRRRRRRCLPVGRRADRPRHHRRHRDVQPSRRRRRCPRRRAQATRDGGDSPARRSLEEAFVLDGPGEYEVKHVLVTGVRTFRDDKRGAERGRNVAFVVELDGVHVVHLGDIAHTLTEEKIGEIGPVDVVCVPIGGQLCADEGRRARRPARPEDRGADAGLRRRARATRCWRKFLHEMGATATASRSRGSRSRRAASPRRRRPSSWSRAARSRTLVGAWLPALLGWAAAAPGRPAGRPAHLPPSGRRPRARGPRPPSTGPGRASARPRRRGRRAGPAPGAPIRQTERRRRVHRRRDERLGRGQAQRQHRGRS